MRKLVAALIFFATAGSAFAHAGHVHTYMGTVTTLRGDRAFVIKTTSGKDLTIETSPNTTWSHGDGHPATQKELAVGTRVVIRMAVDDKTAASVKMSTPAKR